jgi:protein-S-isoprenylcysteine O-methyltransferase Ste14
MRKAVLFIGIALAAASALLLITHHTVAQVRVAGFVLVVCALPPLLVARVQLGKSFAFGPKARTLVTSGFYSKIPHPLYVFVDLVFLGIVIASRVAWLVAVWLAIVAVQSWQARREAKVLEQAFGEEYRRYRAQTWW